jgi:phospholipid transport system transporter-binding protein
MTNTVSIEYQDNSLLINGELNFATVMTLWKESMAKLANYDVLQFDLARVRASNSAGLALLLEWLKYAKHANKKIFFKNIPANLASIIDVAGLHNILSLKEG